MAFWIHRYIICVRRVISPAIWQRAMNTVLQGLQGFHCNIDDMIIMGKTTEEHLSNLEEVLRRLDRYGMRANVQKNEFLKDIIEFCGNVIDSERLRKTTERVSAVLNDPMPKKHFRA